MKAENSWQVSAVIPEKGDGHLYEGSDNRNKKMYFGERCDRIYGELMTDSQVLI